MSTPDSNPITVRVNNPPCQDCGHDKAAHKGGYAECTRCLLCGMYYTKPKQEPGWNMDDRERLLLTTLEQIYKVL